MQLTHQAHAFDRWLRTTQDLSVHTVRAYGDDVAAFERFLGGTYPVERISVDEIYAFVENLGTERGMSSSSIRRRLCGIRRFCAWLHDQGLLAEDPVPLINVRLSRPRRLPKAVSDTDLRRLLWHLRDAIDARGPLASPDRAARSVEATTLLAVALMVGTGMRVGELVAVQLRHVDLPSRTILVLGKGQRERYVYLSNEWIVDLIRSYVGDRFTDGDPTDLLLVNRSGRPLTTAALRGRLLRTADELEMTKRLTPHMLRHTAATQLIESGVDIRFVQRLLGHASLTTTEIYTHVADKSLRHAVTEADVLGKALTFG